MMSSILVPLEDVWVLHIRLRKQAERWCKRNEAGTTHLSVLPREREEQGDRLQHISDHLTVLTGTTDTLQFLVKYWAQYKRGEEAPSLRDAAAQEYTETLFTQ